MPRFNRLLKSGQIEIVPHDEWYLKDGVFNLQQVLDGWIEKLEEALANGYSGLRSTGNTAWLESEDWTDFTQYEREMDSIIGEYRMMALCTYSLDRCSATDVLDVVKNHEFALLKNKGAWELIESSERKRAVEALRDSEARYRDLYDQAPNAYFSVGTDALIKRANLAACELLRCSLEQLVGSTIFDLYADSPYGKTNATVVFDKFRSGESVRNEELQMQRFDGEVIWVSLSVNPIKDRQGKVLESRSSAVDVTERKRAEEELKRINAELDGFAHTVSHDLRGPITTIMGANLVLQSVLQKREESKDNQFETDIQELLEIIDTGVNKAETMIADILALAEAGQVPEEVSDVDVSEVVETILRERNDDIKG